jgi:hypothetical protein
LKVAHGLQSPCQEPAQWRGPRSRKRSPRLPATASNNRTLGRAERLGWSRMADRADHSRDFSSGRLAGPVGWRGRTAGSADSGFPSWLTQLPSPLGSDSLSASTVSGSYRTLSPPSAHGTCERIVRPTPNQPATADSDASSQDDPACGAAADDGTGTHDPIIGLK